MADPVLFFHGKLCGSTSIFRKIKDRVIAKAAIAARREDKLTAHDAYETFDVAIGPGERENTDEAGALVDFAVGGRFSLEAVLNLLHGRAEVLRLLEEPLEIPPSLFGSLSARY